jgi:hypothetical protein
MSRDHSGYTALVLPIPSGPIITELEDGSQANGVRMGALSLPLPLSFTGLLDGFTLECPRRAGRMLFVQNLN